MKIYANQLANHLSQDLSSCYLMVGDEPLQLMEAVDSIRLSAKSQGFTESEVLHVDKSFKWETLSSSMGTMSLFAEKKILELHLPTGKPGAAGSKALVKFVENIPADIILLIQCQEWTASNDKNKWVKTIEKHGIFMRVYMPKPQEFGNWLRNRCRQTRLNVESQAIAIFTVRLEGNLLAAAQELEKLKMRFGEKMISAREISGLVADNARFDVFRLTDAMLDNNLARCIKMVRALKQNNTALVVIHWAIERQTRTLLSLSTLRTGGKRIGPADYRKHGIWQNQQAAIQSCLNRLTSQQLEQLLSDLAELDLIIKGQASGDAWLVVEQWFIDFC